MASQPAKDGMFWGRWHTPCPGTADDGECCSGTEWEVHHVFRNHYRHDEDDRWRVMVPGVEQTQPIDAFEWGEEVVRRT